MQRQLHTNYFNRFHVSAGQMKGIDQTRGGNDAVPC